VGGYDNRWTAWTVIDRIQLVQNYLRNEFPSFDFDTFQEKINESLLLAFNSGFYKLFFNIRVGNAKQCVLLDS